VRVLVLGATGFIGGQIARAAARQGWEVHGLRRREGATGAVGVLPITWHGGAVGETDRLEAAMSGCDVVYHAAGHDPKRDHNIRRGMRIAALTMRSVIEAAGRAGVGRIVYTSSLTTIGAPPASEDRLADERDAYVAGSVASSYHEAKWVMEHEALRATQAGLPVVILIPAAVFGPEDIKPSTSEIVLAIAKGNVPVGIDVETNFVDGRDVAEAHIRAATMGKPGERYIIGGHNLNAADMIREVAQIAGVKPPGRILSRGTVSRMLRAARSLRLPVPDLMFGIDEYRPLNPEKGWRTFGITPRPFEETIRDTVAWFREHGYVANGDR
jgi:dihydroflavonol-4-reductase